MRELTGAQARQAIDCEQVFRAWREVDGLYRSRFAGSMAWKTVGGRRYLYRKTNGIWKSLGADTEQTRLAHDRFHAGRDAIKVRRASLDTEIAAMAPVNRAMRLGRVPWIAARILRRLDRIGALGRGLRVAGTHAIYAYERMGGVHFGSDVIATRDIDLLYDARGALDLVGTELAGAGLVGLLRKIDDTFAATQADSFRAANDTGFMVDLIMPSSRNAATRTIRRTIGNDPGDLAAVEIDGLIWLENSPVVEAVAIDERGYPLSIAAPDPRVFACHKLWLSGRDDREPIKRRRDAAQARAVVGMLATYLPALRFDDPALEALPLAVLAPGRRLVEEIGADTRKFDGPIDWS